MFTCNQLIAIHVCRLSKSYLHLELQCCAQDAGPLLPPVIHATVEVEDMLPGRLIVIGDVHGCLDELHELLDRVEYSQGNDTLIFAGDLVDKGPFSAEVALWPLKAPKL